MNNQRSATLLLLLISCLIPAHAVSRFDRQGASSAYTKAYHKIDAESAEQTQRANREFYREKKRIERSLQALDRKPNQRAADLAAAQKKLDKTLARIRREAIQKKRAVRKNTPVGGPAVAPEIAESSTPTPERSSSWLSGFNLHGQLQQQTAMRLNEPRVLRKNRYQAYLEQEATLLDSLKFHVSERAFFDTVPYHENKALAPDAPRNTLEEQSELREAFVDTSLGPIDARIGKQIVVWGEATSLFVSDVVNGKDLRETILPDFDWIRRPQWSADFTWISSAMTAEALWSIPEFHRFASAGGDFAYPVFTSSSTVTAEPAVTVANSEAGLRLSRLFGGLDVSTFYYYTWDKFRPLRRRLNPSGPSWEPYDYRQSVFGATFSAALGETILRGEYVVRPRVFLPSASPTDSDGLIAKTATDYLVGADHTFFGHLQLNAQVIQRLISAWSANEALFTERRSRTHLALYAKTDFFSRRVEPEVLWIKGLSENDWLVRPKIRFQVTDAVILKIGADIFGGDGPTGLFSPFESQDRIYLESDLHF